MYPHNELMRLAAHKAALRSDIARTRLRCARAASRLARPLEWMDRVRAFARRWSPLARFTAVPLGFVFQRLLFRRSKVLGALVRWGPLAASVFRRVSSAVIARPRASTAAQPARRLRDDVAAPNFYRPDGD